MAVSQQGRDELEDEVYFLQGGRCSLKPRAAGEVAEGSRKPQVCAQETWAGPGAKAASHLGFIMEFMEVSGN